MFLKLKKASIKMIKKRVQKYYNDNFVSALASLLSESAILITILRCFFEHWSQCWVKTQAGLLHANVFTKNALVLVILYNKCLHNCHRQWAIITIITSCSMLSNSAAVYYTTYWLRRTHEDYQHRKYRVSKFAKIILDIQNHTM